MRLSQPPTLLSLLAVVLSSTHIAQAKPFRRGDSLVETDNHSLVERQGGYACGFGSLTCETADACYTDANGQAQCATTGSGTQNNADNGQWQLYTTTYTTNELTTITSTYSLQVSPTAQVATGGGCDTSVGETPCGQILSSGQTLCCASGQQCLYRGQCGSSGAGAGDVSSSYLYSVTAAATGTAFIRPTSATTQTVTSTGSATTTVPFQTASPTASASSTAAGMQSTTSNNGLSGGAIAGIVIGVLLGIFLLLLLCGCLCFKGILDSFLALLGLGPKRKRRENTYIEERHSHHASGGGGGGRTWFGQGPSRPQREKKSSGIGGLGAVAGGLTALAVVLGLKRRIDRRDKTSYTTGSSYTYSDYTSSSSESSDRRTRRSSRR
ncbi:MAG: hypothetical protein Q9195_003875 [Heterodermia aff. obscurata]